MTKEQGVKLVKAGANLIVGLGITMLCSAFAGNLAGSTGAGFLKKTCMAIGGAVIGGMVVNQAEKYIEGEVDSAVEKVDKLVEMAKNAAPTAEEAV